MFTQHFCGLIWRLQGWRSRKLVDDTAWTTQIWRVCFVRKDGMSYYWWNEWKQSVYVTVLAFATIEDVNICRSSSSGEKKFHPTNTHPTASFESAIQATSYTIVLFETVEHIFEWMTQRDIVWIKRNFSATVPVSPDFYSMLKLRKFVYYKSKTLFRLVF